MITGRGGVPLSGAAAAAVAVVFGITGDVVLVELVVLLLEAAGFAGSSAEVFTEALEFWLDSRLALCAARVAALVVALVVLGAVFVAGLLVTEVVDAALVFVVVETEVVVPAVTEGAVVVESDGRSAGAASRSVRSVGFTSLEEFLGFTVVAFGSFDFTFFTTFLAVGLVVLPLSLPSLSSSLSLPLEESSSSSLPSLPLPSSLPFLTSSSSLPTSLSHGSSVASI